MKINVSGLSIAFYLFCAAVILSEYSFVGRNSSKPLAKKSGSTIELATHSRAIASKKENWPSKSTPAYHGTVGLNSN